MSDIPRFHHVLTLFTKISFSRPAEATELAETPVNVKVKIVDNAALPQRLQINLSVDMNNEPGGVSFAMEVAGLFDYMGDEPPTRQQKMSFLSERGLFIVWPSVTHMVKHISVEMGLSPVQIVSPDEFGIDELAKNYLAKE